jgi:hypothetical protein
MAKPSVFRDFISALQKQWRTRYPFIRPLTEARGSMPMASTFYAGVAPDSGLHIFFYFQHSTKAWQVGQFTINLVLAKDEHRPRHWGFAEKAADGGPFGEGPQRIGFLIEKKDKWWHLKDDDPPIVTRAWRPSNYADPKVVIEEAVKDVSRDVLTVLQMLGVPTAAGSNTLTSE